MKIKKVFQVSAIILFILLVVFLVVPTNVIKITNFDIKDRNFIEKLDSDTILIQEFKADNNYNRMGFEIATYCEILSKGTLNIEVSDEKNKKKIYKIKAKKIYNDSVYFINYKLKKNKSYKVKIFTENLDNKITFYTTKSNNNDANLRINDEKKDYNLILYFSKVGRNYEVIWALSFICIIFLIVYVLLCDKEVKK